MTCRCEYFAAIKAIQHRALSGSREGCIHPASTCENHQGKSWPILSTTAHWIILNHFIRSRKSPSSRMPQGAAWQGNWLWFLTPLGSRMLGHRNFMYAPFRPSSQILADCWHLIHSSNLTSTTSKNYTSLWCKTTWTINRVTSLPQTHRTSVSSATRTTSSCLLRRFNRFTETATSQSPIFPPSRSFLLIRSTSTKLGSSFSQISRRPSNSKASCQSRRAQIKIFLTSLYLHFRPVDPA